MQSKMWESIVADSSVKFFWKDKDRRYLGASKAFLDFNGLKLEDILGKTDSEMGWCVDEKAFEDGEAEVLTKGCVLRKVPGQCIINGIVHNIMSDKRPIYDKGQIIGLMGHFIDVDEELSHLDKLYNERKLDPVTGLMNVSALADVTRSYAHNYAAKNIDYALIILRNENHHRIVENYGEEFGNKLLKKTGEVLLEVTDGKCAAAKCLGSDFAMVTNVTEPDALKALTTDLKNRVEAIKKIDGSDVTLKISIGYRLRSEDGISDENIYSAVLDELMK
jgi:GGDEF domain-containing protein